MILQLLTAGAEHWKTTVVEVLAELTGASNIYERSDVEVRRLEGLPARVGSLFGDPPADLIQIEENGLKFWVDVKSGQKTGFYLDQRNNRQQVRDAGQRQIDFELFLLYWRFFCLCAGRECGIGSFCGIFR